MSGLGEALAAPSAIAGLISLGIEVAKSLVSVADGVGAAGEELREISREIDFFTSEMDAIQEVLHRQNHVAPKILALIDRIVDNSGNIFKTFNAIQESLAPLLVRFRDSTKKLEQVGLRVMWYIREKRKVLGCRTALKRHILMLTPILTALVADNPGHTTQVNYQ